MIVPMAMTPTSTSLAEIARLLGLTPPVGSDAVLVTGIGALATALPGQLSFLSDAAHVKTLPTTRAAAVLIHKKIAKPDGAPCPLLVVDDADLAVAKVLEFFAPPVPQPAHGIDPAARVHPTATLGDGCRIGHNVTIGAGAILGARCVIYAGSYIGEDTKLGDDCICYPNVVIRERCTLGHRVIVNAGAVIGTDGFGYRWNGTKHAKVPQIGTVEIGDDVEIGSCACIDRAKFAATRIGQGTKIDNLVQIGHNVVLGPHCIITGQAGVAGSAVLGTGVMLGGQSAVRDHITMGDGAMLAACSGVMEDVPAKQIVSGLPALPHRQSLREQAALRRLPDLVVQVRKLEEELRALKAQLPQP